MSVPDTRTHEDMLRSERRSCPQCGFVINNPMTDRCPRCFSHVERKEENCGSCTWQGNCEFAHLVQDSRKKKE